MALYDHIAQAAAKYVFDTDNILLAQASVLLSDIERAERIMHYSVAAAGEKLCDISAIELFSRCVFQDLTMGLRLSEHILVAEVIHAITDGNTSFHLNYAEQCVDDVKIRPYEWEGLPYSKAGYLS